MSKELAVLVIHGMGSQSDDFAVEMIQELNRRLSDSGKDPKKIAWQSIYWANILKDRQVAYLKEAKEAGRSGLHQTEEVHAHFVWRRKCISKSSEH